MFEYEKILVPTDFSEHALSALNFARSMAHKSNAEIHILHVVEPNLIPSDVLVYPKTTLDEVEVLTKTKANEKMEKMLGELDNMGVKIYSSVRRGNPPDSIVEYAEEKDIDLICISSYGASGLEHLIFGSVAEKVLRKAECDVIALKTSTDNK